MKRLKELHKYFSEKAKNHCEKSKEYLNTLDTHEREKCLTEWGLHCAYKDATSKIQIEINLKKLNEEINGEKTIEMENQNAEND